MTTPAVMSEGRKKGLIVGGFVLGVMLMVVLAVTGVSLYAGRSPAGSAVPVAGIRICSSLIAWGALPSGAGTAVFVGPEIPGPLTETVTLTLKTGPSIAQTATVPAGNNTRRFDFPHDEPLTVSKVIVTSGLQRCDATPNASGFPTPPFSRPGRPR